VSEVSERRDMIAALVVVVGVIGYVLATRAARLLAAAPSEDQCAALLDHYLDQASRQHHPGIGDEDIARAIEASEGSSERVVDVQSCRERLTRDQVECAMNAPNVDELERCVQ
jgi:hypothetical protein